MKAGRLGVTAVTAMALLAFGNCTAAEGNKQSAASRQSSKARDYATRDEKEAPAEVQGNRTAAVVEQKDGDKMPALDSPVVEKAARDTGENWKKLDKVLDRF
jgi:hypothetical protein